MAKMLTEPEAWRRLAKKFAAKWACGGICFGIAMLHDGDKISEATARTMRNNLAAHRPKGVTGYWWSKTPGGNKLRAAVCRKLARETAPKKRKRTAGK